MDSIVHAQAIIERESLVEDTNGITYVTGYHVTGLSGKVGALFEALRATGIPAYGQPHGSEPNLFVSKREPRPFGKNSRTEAWVDVTYRPPDFSNLADQIVRFNGYVCEVRTNFDIFGMPIKVKYQPQSATTGTFKDQVGLVRGTKAKGVLTCDMIVYKEPSYLTPFLNQLNAHPWRGGATATWMCVDVQIERVLYRAGWRVHLAFEYDEETHIRVAGYRLIGGVLPADISPVPIIRDTAASPSQQNGYTSAWTNQFSNFSALPVPLLF